MCFCKVTVTEPEGRVVAHGTLVHRYGWVKSRHSSGDWSNGEDGGLQNRRSGFDSLVPR